jgi:hypothetical protein
VTIEPKLMSEPEMADALRTADVWQGTPTIVIRRLLAHIAALGASHSAEIAEAKSTVECLMEQLSEVGGVVSAIEARTVEAIATWLDSLGDYEISKCATDVRNGAWRTK